jgi:uncharacterized membrane-anchored protein
VSWHALKRVMLVVGLVVLLASVITVRRVHADTRALEVALIAALAAGLFLSVSGLLGVLTEPSETPEQRDAEELELAEERSAGRGPTVAGAMGAYLLVVAFVLGAVVGLVQRDMGVAIQTFTAALILGGIIFGIGYIFAYRPTAEE